MIRDDYDSPWKEMIERLFEPFIDWIMVLPEEKEQELDRILESDEAEMGKKYVTSWERMGRKRGELNASRKLIREALDARFGQVPDEVTDSLNQIGEPEELRLLHRQAVLCASLDEFISHLPVAA